MKTEQLTEKWGAPRRANHTLPAITTDTLKRADIADYLASDDDDDDDGGAFDERDMAFDKTAMDEVARTEMLRQRLLFGGRNSIATRQREAAGDEDGSDEGDEMQITFDAPLDDVDGEDMLVEREEKKTQKKKLSQRKGDKTSATAAADTALIGLGDEDLLNLSRGVDDVGDHLKAGKMKKNTKKELAKKKNKRAAHSDEVSAPPSADDDRFAALYSSPDFALDPTDPRYKKDLHAHIAREKRLQHSKGVEKSQQRRRDHSSSLSGSSSLSKSLLVANLKKKAGHSMRR